MLFLTFALLLAAVDAACVTGNDCRQHGDDTAHCVNGECACDPHFTPPLCTPVCVFDWDCTPLEPNHVGGRWTYKRDPTNTTSTYGVQLVRHIRNCYDIRVVSGAPAPDTPGRARTGCTIHGGTAFVATRSFNGTAQIATDFKSMIWDDPANTTWHRHPNGQCVDNQCVCSAGWMGPQCSVAACALTCRHGGVPNAPNASCTYCLRCALGWEGKTCSQWNPAVLPQLVEYLHSVANKSRQALAALAPLHPLPGTVGWGVNAITGVRAPLPIVLLTYNNSNKVWGKFRTPTEAVFIPYQDPAGEGTAYVLPGITELEAARTTLRGQNKGLNGGIFAQSLAAVFEQVWNGTHGDGSLTAVRWSYPIFQMSLPADPATHQFKYEFDAFAKMAIDALPPVFNATTSAAFEAFIAEWGTSYTSTSINGGLVEQLSRWNSWITTQRALSDAPGGAPAPFTQTSLQTNADDVFFNTTGLQDPSWEPGKPDGDYTRNARTFDTTCYGGDPNKCSGKRFDETWLPTVADAPVTISYTLGAIDQLVTDDPTTSAAVKAAIDAYAAKQDAAWAKTDVCRSCHGAGSCAADKHVDRCTCTNGHLMGLGCTECRYGWQDHSKLCKTPVCNPACANGGTCANPFTCHCPPHATGATCAQCTAGWAGKDCAAFTCGSACSRTGNPRCVGPLKCVPLCDGKETLPNGFTCKAPNDPVPPSPIGCAMGCSAHKSGVQNGWQACCAGKCQMANERPNSYKYKCCGTQWYFWGRVGYPQVHCCQCNADGTITAIGTPAQGCDSPCT